MIRIVTLLVLLSASAFAAPAQEEVKSHFTKVLETQLRTMFLARIEQNPGHPETEQMKLQMEEIIKKTVPDAFKAFSPELELTEAESETVLKQKQNKASNQKQIQEDVALMQKSPLPKPALVTIMLDEYNKNQNQDEWFLEVLQRLTSGTVRQLKERGELK